MSIFRNGTLLSKISTLYEIRKNIVDFIIQLIIIAIFVLLIFNDLLIIIIKKSQRNRYKIKFRF